MEKIAIISDIHGNVPALETVLGDIRQRGIKRIFCLGDLVGKGPQPEKAVDMCQELCEVVIQGNHDDFMASGREHPALPFIGWHRERLGKVRLDYLNALPNTHDFIMSGRKVRLYHASQIGVHHRIRMNASQEEHRAMFTNTDFTGDGFTPDVVGYGDIHGVFYKTFIGGEILFNVGSVGNPLDEPRAAYAIMEGEYGNAEPGYFSVQMIRLPYDIDTAIQKAKEEGLPEEELQAWEDELRTGRYRLDPASRIWRDPSSRKTP